METRSDQCACRLLEELPGLCLRAVVVRSWLAFDTQFRLASILPKAINGYQHTENDGRSMVRRLLHVNEVAESMGLPVATLYQQRHRRVGVGALAIRVGRHLRWRPEDIEAWLDAQSEKAQEEAVG